MMMVDLGSCSRDSGESSFPKDRHHPAALVRWDAYTCDAVEQLVYGQGPQ